MTLRRGELYMRKGVEEKLLFLEPAGVDKYLFYVMGHTDEDRPGGLVELFATEVIPWRQIRTRTTAMYLWMLEDGGVAVRLTPPTQAEKDGTTSHGQLRQRIVGSIRINGTVTEGQFEG